jgi:hypothetical protein
MSAATVWQTDDCCLWCGGLVRAQIQADGALTQECGGGWYVTWAPDLAGGEW